MMEILRHVSLTPIGVFHGTLFDTKLDGYDFPKGTWLVGHMYAVHFDKKTWGDPENFRPERFLDKDGHVIPKPDALMPFSVGKRQCLGESLARDTLFLFTTSIFQRFSVSPDPKDPHVSFECGKGFARIPKPFKVVFTDRMEMKK